MQSRESLDQLFSATYEELRRLAATVRRGDPSATLNATALVHEAWIKLAKSPPFALTSRLHFRRLAGRAMRRLLVEAARRRKAQKRGGEDAILVTLGDSAESLSTGSEDFLALNSALEELAQMDSRQAQIVECHYFCGLSAAETAELVEVSKTTVERDLRAAKAWLSQELRRVH